MASSVSADYDLRIRFTASMLDPPAFSSLEEKLRYVSSGIERAVELMCWVRDHDGSSDGSCAVLAGEAILSMERIKSVMGQSLLAHSGYDQQMGTLISKLNELNGKANQMLKKVHEEIETVREQKKRHFRGLALGLLVTPIAIGVVYNYVLSKATSGENVMEAFFMILVSTVLTNLFSVAWTWLEDKRKKLLSKLEQKGKFAAWIERATQLLCGDVINFILPHIPPPSAPATPSDASSVN